VGNIPEYRRDPIQRPPTDTSGTARGDVARAFGNLGQAAGGVYETMVKVEDARAELDQRNWLNKATPVFEKEVQAIRDNHEREFKDSPVDRQDYLNHDLERLNAKYLKEANGPLARKVFGDTAQKYFQNVLSQNRRWAENQNLENVATSSKKGLGKLTGDVYRLPIAKASVKMVDGKPEYINGFPVMVETESAETIGPRLDAMLEIADKEAEPIFHALTLTLNPQAREAMMGDFKKQKVMMGFKRIIDEASSQPEGPRPELLNVARKLLETKKYDEVLGPEGVSDLQDALKYRYSKLRKRKEAVDKNYEDLRFKNPWKFFEKTGVEIPDLDLQNLNPVAVEERMELLDATNKKLGTNALPLNSREMDYMTKVFPAKPFEEQETFFENAKNIPEEDYYKMARQISEKVPVYGGIFSLMRQGGEYSKERAKDLYEGINLLKKNPITKKPLVEIPMAEARTVFNASVGKMIKNPELRKTVEQAYIATLAKKKDSAGANLSAKDEKRIMVDSISSLVGTPVVVGKTKIFSYQRDDGSFASGQETRDLWSAVTLTKVKSTHGDVPRLPDLSGQPGKAFDIAAGKDRIDLTAVGQNRYTMSFKDQRLLAKDGKPFVFDFGLFSSGFKQGGKWSEKTDKSKSFYQKYLYPIDNLLPDMPFDGALGRPDSDEQ